MTRAKDISKILTDADIIGTLDVTGATTITTADNTAQLTLTSTDADSNFGPLLTMYRNSSSPADADFLGDIEFQGENSAGETITYAQVFGRTVDVTDGTEDGRIAIKTMRAGASRSALDISATEIVLNDDSEDVDFRVESNGNANMLFVDGGNDRVGIGTSSIAEPLRVQADSDTDFSASGAAFNKALMLKNATAGAANCVSLAMATESNGEVYLSAVQNSGNNAADFVISTRDSGARAEVLRVKSNGAVTMPLQPAFLVQGTAVSNVGLNADHTIAFGTEIFDQNADFASNVFTAPVTGKYQFNLSVRIDNLDDATQYYMIQIRTSNRDIQSIHGMSGYDADVSYMSFNLSVLTDMDAGDTSRAILGVPSLGSAQADLTDVTRFSGYLVA